MIFPHISFYWPNHSCQNNFGRGGGDLDTGQPGTVLLSWSMDFNYILSCIQVLLALCRGRLRKTAQCNGHSGRRKKVNGENSES